VEILLRLMSQYSIIRANETEALRGLGAVNASLLQVIQLQAFLLGEAPAFIRIEMYLILPYH